MIFRRKKMYAIVGAVLLLVVASISLYYMGAEQKDTQSVRTQATLTSQELFLQLQQEKNAELALYIEKAIEVKGSIIDITYRNGVYSIILDGTNDRHIICEMQRDQNPEILKFKKGEEIVIKGILKGFLVDAILLNCIVV